jgi:hypothetical protein
MEAILLTVTLLSLVTAVGASVLAWRVMRAERLRSEARIAALAAGLRTDGDERPIRIEEPRTHTYAPAESVDLTVQDAAVAAPGGMFAEKPRERSMFRLAGAVGVATVVVAAVISTLVVTSDGPAPAAREPENAATPAAVPADVQLELIALGHEREADRLTVRGIVRGELVRPLTAVVLLFSREGAYITSARADVQAGAVPAGERKFVVTVPSPGDVGRYRVSFRSDDHIVPHVDRRAQPGTAASEAGSARSQI